MSDDTNMRDEFEAWVASQCDDDPRAEIRVVDACERELDGDQAYTYRPTQSFWECWQAAWNRRTDTRAAALEDQLEKISQWCDAYPLDIFPEPTSDQWAMLHEAAKAFSPGIDRFSASNMRHVVNGVRALAAKTTEG